MPKDGKPVMKEFEGKQYHVSCKYHPQQWVCHTKAACSKNPTNVGLPPPVDDQGRKLLSARFNLAITDPSEGSAEESQEEDY